MLLLLLLLVFFSCQTRLWHIYDFDLNTCNRRNHFQLRDYLGLHPILRFKWPHFFISLYFRLSWGKNIFPWALKSEIHYKCTKLSVPLICRRINWTCDWKSIQSKFNKHQWPRDQSLTLECFDDSIFDQIYLKFKSLLHAVWNLAISSLKLRKLLC